MNKLIDKMRKQDGSYDIGKLTVQELILYKKMEKEKQLKEKS